MKRRDTKIYKVYVGSYCSLRGNYECRKEENIKNEERLNRFNNAIEKCRTKLGDDDIINDINDMYKDACGLLKLSINLNNTSMENEKKSIDNYARILTEEYGVSDLDSFYFENKDNPRYF